VPYAYSQAGSIRRKIGPLDGEARRRAIFSKKSHLMLQVTPLEGAIRDARGRGMPYRTVMSRLSAGTSSMIGALLLETVSEIVWIFFPQSPADTSRSISLSVAGRLLCNWRRGY